MTAGQPPQSCHPPLPPPLLPHPPPPTQPHQASQPPPWQHLAGALGWPAADTASTVFSGPLWRPGKPLHPPSTLNTCCSGAHVTCQQLISASKDGDTPGWADTKDGTRESAVRTHVQQPTLTPVSKRVSPSVTGRSSIMFSPPTTRICTTTSLHCLPLLSLHNSYRYVLQCTSHAHASACMLMPKCKTQHLL